MHPLCPSSSCRPFPYCRPEATRVARAERVQHVRFLVLLLSFSTEGNSVRHKQLCLGMVLECFTGGGDRNGNWNRKGVEGTSASTRVAQLRGLQPPMGVMCMEAPKASVKLNRSEESHFSTSLPRISLVQTKSLPSALVRETSERCCLLHIPMETTHDTRSSPRWTSQCKQVPQCMPFYGAKQPC